ncbi:MAG: 3'-5' exonuclease [Hyphomicrobium sp.]
MFKFVKRKIDWMALNDRSYEYLFDPPGTDEVVSIDCETTGLNPRKDDIVSIAAVKIKGRHILASEAFRTTVKPQAAMGADSIKIHQIRKSDVAGEGPILKELPALLQFIGNRPLVGYWVSFDMRMLNKHIFKMLNITLQNPAIDVCDMYYERKYGNAPPGTRIDLRFAAILEDLALPPLQAHDALNDAVSTAQMYLILKDLKTRGVFLKRKRNWDQPNVPVG